MNKPKRDQQKRPAKRYNRIGPVANLATLISTIKDEGAAYRAEEQREDSGKKFREWTTIVLISLTLGAVCFQVYEMIKVYGPIKRQADAMQIAADANRRSAEGADRTLIAAHRAWVGPSSAKFGALPAVGQEVEITVQYQNLGRQPAQNFVFEINPFVGSVEDDAKGVLANRILFDTATCFTKPSRSDAQVVYPTTGFSSYTLYSKLDKAVVNDDVVQGNRVIIVPGCFRYVTFGQTRRSAFCFFYRAKFTRHESLNFCTNGNRAD